MHKAVAFLHSIDDIPDFPLKISRSPGGFLRTSCAGQLKRQFQLTREEAEAAMDLYLGLPK